MDEVDYTQGQTADPVLLEPAEGWLRTNTQPMDIRDILTAKGFEPATLLDGFSLRFYEQGEAIDMPSETSQIELVFSYYVPQGVPEQMVAGDWYVINLPEGILVDGPQRLSLSADDAEIATVEVETGPVRIKFSDAMQAYFEHNSSEDAPISIDLKENRIVIE